MGFTDKFRYILKPIFVGTAVLSLLALFFVSVFAFIEYRWHLSTYHTAQQKELRALQQKTETTIEDLKNLSQLTKARILASGDDLGRIQNILISVYHLLPNYPFPKIQKVSYAKLSKPQMMVTRVGLSPLNLNATPVIDTLEKDPTVIFDKNTIVTKTLVHNEKDKLEGVLEIQIDFAEFKDSLGRFETIAFQSFISSNKENLVLQLKPFKVYAKAHARFWEFFSTNKIQYIAMLLFYLFLLMLIKIRFYFFYRRLYHIYEKKIKKLTAQISKLNEERELLAKNLDLRQKDLDCHQISLEAYRKFHGRLMYRKKEQICYLLRSLEIVRQALQNPRNPLPEEERIEIISSCRNTARLLSEGLIANTKTEPINLKHLLDELFLLFAERIHRFNITLNIQCPKDLTFYGDSLLTEFVLATLIGKPIHRVPKNGKVSIIISSQNDALFCEVEDNGYFFLEDKEEFIKKSFDLFMLKDAFQQTCQENGLIYEHSKTNNGNNLAKLIFPPPSQDISTRNVIPLFQ